MSYSCHVLVLYALVLRLCPRSGESDRDEGEAAGRGEGAGASDRHQQGGGGETAGGGGRQTQGREEAAETGEDIGQTTPPGGQVTNVVTDLKL